MPILYDQPGDRYILRIDNRRYQMPYPTKEGIARLMSAANYPRTKLLFEEYKRALEERAKAESVIRSSQANLTRENESVARLNRSLDSLRNQLALLRTLPNVDLNEILFLQNQIRATITSLASAEAQEAKAGAGAGGPTPCRPLNGAPRWRGMILRRPGRSLLALAGVGRGGVGACGGGGCVAGRSRAAPQRASQAPAEVTQQD